MIQRKRIDALRQHMKAAGVDGLLMAATSDMLYAIGRKLPNTERFNALIMGREGKPILIVPKLQYPLVSDLAQTADIITWIETDDPVALAGTLVESMNIRSLAVDGLMRSAFLLRLLARLGKGVTISNGSPIVSASRLIKDAEEIAIMSDAGRRFDAIWDEFWTKGKLIGVTERDVVEQIRKLAFAHGFDSLDWCDVGSGPNGASPLHHHSGRIIQPGDPVVIDFACTLRGYFMDTCRTPVAGEPHPDFVKIHDITAQAHNEANRRAVPGMAAEDVDAAARAVIEAAGYGENFMHRLGHGLGLDAHEEPYIVKGNRLKLLPGMIYSNEPGIYIDDRWGIRIEDILLMTEKGAQSFNAASRDIVTMK